MQEILRQQATPLTEKQEDQESSGYLNTQLSNSVSEQSSASPIEGVRKEVGQGVSTQERVPAEVAHTPVADNLHTRIASRLRTKDSKEATVRLSVDVSERLHERIKVYCASNRIPTTRALVVALLENLLDEAGY